jgi:hypothetical protein
MYYPKSEILKVDYTSGGEFLIRRTLKFYKGFYYSTNDGKFFSGKEYQSDTQELIYSLQTNNTSSKKDSYNFYYSEPTDTDYEKGFFTRYVIKRVNGGLDNILEVSESEFNRASKDPLYNTKSFVWKLTGPLYTTPEGIPGIANENQKTLDEVEKTINEVKKYFTNLAQYAK